MGAIIIQNCNQCVLDIPFKYANILYNDFAIKHPNSFYLRTRVRGMKDWDGKIKFINKSGTFKIGLLPAVVNKLNEYGYSDFKVVDNRKPVPVITKPIKQIGDFKLRPEQVTAVSSILNSRLKGTPFHIGVIDYSVNAGKSLIMSAIYLSFQRKLKTLLITNDSDWLKQAKEEFKRYLPNETITFVQGSKISNWANFSIGMVQSLSRNVKSYQSELTKIDMVLVDEADLASSKTYQNVITHLYNTRVRIGLSGTIYLSKLAKDRVKNLTLESFFGTKLAEFRLKDSIAKGYSTNTLIKMIPTQPWYGNWTSKTYTYQDEYDDTIVENSNSYQLVLDRLTYNMRYGRLPALIVCKFVKHAELMSKFLKYKLPNLKIEAIHVKTPDKLRNSVLENFRKGEVDILISTTIIARGKNLPLLKYLINTASMDSQEKSIQFLGRLVRTHQSKRMVYLDDIHYQGTYLNRHGNHRKRYYLKEGLKVIDMAKHWKNHKNHSLTGK